MSTDEFNETSKGILNTSLIPTEPNNTPIITTDEFNIIPIMTNFKVLSSIDKNDKLDTRNEIFEKEPYIILYQGLLRKYRGDDRYSNYEKINKMILKFEKIVNTALDDNDIVVNDFTFYDINDFKRRLKPLVLNSIEGLENFKKTYIDDIKYSYNIESLIIRLKIISDKLNI